MGEIIGGVQFDFHGTRVIAKLGGNPASWSVRGKLSQRLTAHLTHYLNTFYDPKDHYQGPADGEFGCVAIQKAAEDLKGESRIVEIPENPNAREGIDGHDLAESDGEEYTLHAPEGGASLGGTFFRGGEFIPNDAIARATAAEKQSAGITPDVSQQRTATSKPFEVVQHEPVKQELASGKEVEIHQLGERSLNRVYRVHFDNGTQAVFKPESGEGRGNPESSRRQGRSNVPGDYYRREVAASKINDLLGLDLVPPTVARTINGELGSVQEWQGGAQSATTPSIDRWDGKKGLAEAAAFDFLIGNADRHMGNWMLENGKLRLIDNGLAFPDKNAFPPLKTPKHKNGHSLLLNYTSNLGMPILPEVRAWASKEQAINYAMQEAGIDQASIDRTMERLHLLADPNNQTYADLYKGLPLFHGMDELPGSDQRTRKR